MTTTSEPILWHAWECPFSMRGRLMLAEKQIAYASEPVAWGDLPPGIRKRNPRAWIPVLEHDACIIYDTRVLAEYIEEAWPDTPGLMPDTPVSRARARLLLDWCDREFVPAAQALDKARLRHTADAFHSDDPRLADPLRKMYGVFHELDELLDDGPFLLGSFGMTDIFFAPWAVLVDALGLRRDEIPAKTIEWIGCLRDRASIAREIQRRTAAATARWEKTGS